MEARPRLRIGEWIADPATNELLRGADRVRIEPKAMDVLTLLAGRAGAVVSREELFAAVWPGTVVGDEALSQSITKLRRALGDDPRSPAYIETISKRGYRLLAPVSSGEAPKRRHPYSIAAGVALIAIATIGAYLYFAPESPHAVDEMDALERQGSWVAVVVQPFESAGPSTSQQAYLAHGISDELMTSLGRLSGLRVIRSAGAPPAAGGSRYVVSGSVQREGDAMRINVHLLDAKTNELVWSERYERPFGDLFAVQDDVIRRVTESLPAKVSDAERKRLAKRHTRSLEAYDHFLRAQALFLARGVRENREARALYRKAVETDASFARAYAGLAMTYAMEHRLIPGGDARPDLDRALELAESAKLIDPDIAEVHWAIGFVHAQRRDHEQAIAALRRAIELDRSFADAYALLGGIQTYVGRPGESIPLLRAAMRLNPDGGYLYYLLLGRAYLFEDDTEQALINLRAALLRNPADLETHVYLAAAAAAAGDRTTATWEAEEIRSLKPDFAAATWLDSYPLTSAPHRGRLERLLGGAGL